MQHAKNCHQPVKKAGSISLGGEINRASYRPSGFHSARNYPEKLIKNLTLPPDELGVYAGYYGCSSWEKFSTFFPQSMDRVQIKKAVEQAFKNPIEKGKFIVIGQADNGMKIKIIFKKRLDGTFETKSAFPLYKGEIDSKKFIQQLGRSKEVYHRVDLEGFLKE